MSASASIALRIEHEGAFETFTVSSIVIDDADLAKRQVNAMKSPGLKNTAMIDFIIVNAHSLRSSFITHPLHNPFGDWPGLLVIHEQRQQHHVSEATGMT